jgi:hypothetical protein
VSHDNAEFFAATFQMKLAEPSDLGRRVAERVKVWPLSESDRRFRFWR